MDSPLRPSRRISAPHIVAPTNRYFRDSVLSTSLASEPPLQPSNDNPPHLYGAVDDNINGGQSFENVEGESSRAQRISFDATKSSLRSRQPILYQQWQRLERASLQIPAIALITLFHLMVGIPFGVSYFPVGWKSSSSEAASPEHDNAMSEAHGGFVLNGTFPLPGKQALGIRMFLFSTIIGQLALTFTSNFPNCIALQMVENVPFCQALTYIVVETQGYGKEALSTLFFLFGLSSVIVGLVFYLLGRMELGRILYFFPAHVLVGCIGGIGVFIARTGLEVTSDISFTLSVNGLRSFLEKFHLLAVVFGFEAGLRLISQCTKDGSGNSKYPLLAPIYFILITPMFYLGLWMLSGNGQDEEYFFPPLNECSDESECNGGTSSLWGESGEIFHLMNLSTVSWTAVVRSIPTMIALVMFSLIHVPINIPAFAVSTNVDVDMNVELTAHGYSNGIVGMFGGVQNYMAYTQSMIYFKSGGNGKASSLAVTLFTTVLFFVGPSIAVYMPRCMAGTLLLHCGIDLFLEGIYDSYGRYDYLEYCGIWAIVIVMTFAGMEAALLAGAISALLTYAIQSIAYPKPIRGSMTAVTLRSSEWNRSPCAYEILDNDETGRIRVRVVQFQGHLFFGNVSLFSDGVKELIKNSPVEESPYVIIIDFTLVLGIDSSAAQAIMKLRDSLTSQFGIKLSIFVPGKADGFPCEVNLSKELNSPSASHQETNYGSHGSHGNGRLLARLTGSRVCDDLDQALVFAEDSLIAMVNPGLLYDNIKRSFLGAGNKQIKSLEEEKIYAIDLLHRKCPGEERDLVEQFFSFFSREIYDKGDILWKQGSKSDSCKLLMIGSLISSLENEAGTTETISIGSVIGESGLVENYNRNSTVHVLANGTILYSLSRESWEEMKQRDPRVAHVLYAIVVRYLTLRVQHVSNRIFETRCLPI
mmetsp:Transcript_38565/g.82282  ORF Transcript_38565/g.82282 Transcript_38565/m.82282 type:complete len:928 (-) Transcript_38565:858-3641(-)|eukprot:CAMPEP_0172566168 /NCGR_PEP_ID=MMETSP1067-20121228/110874_1 /TAXON_ID=265564 ORGANISM="Thalassiosira punctigera, Strain Tpunct2005C2" /NCGR_SAMPLE_ID=MMETSP1067 /ASSEMBLY_ACC=CAM_ASM_000444 /LENGTH=927 /DNA_ID=CAMNT_0013357215 /DNA_START=41 /DNA_END=2824 /DNA_ORIENTATION=+